MTERTLTYRPGSWLGVIGANATVLLPGSEKARAAALWPLVDDGAEFDAVLDALVAGGLSSLPGFVLLTITPETVRILVRGGAVATLETEDGTTRVAADPGAMWTERTVHATDFAIALPDETADGAALAVVDGLVRLGALETPVVAPPNLAPVVQLAPVAVPAADLDLDDDLEHDLDDDIDDEVDGEVDSDLEDTGADGVAPLGPPPTWTPGAPSAPPLPPVALAPVVAVPVDVPDLDAPDFDDAETDILGVIQEPIAVPDPLTDPLDEPEAVADDEPTGQAEPITETFTGPIAADNLVTEALVPPPVTVAHLVFSSGEEVDVEGLVVIGRRPDAGRFPPEDQPRLVAVPSPHSEISSTHLEVRPGAGADLGKAVVTDLGSTNGTLIVQPGQRPEELRPGIAVVLDSGALVDLGDGLTIRVR